MIIGVASGAGTTGHRAAHAPHFSKWLGTGEGDRGSMYITVDYGNFR